ncbi:Triple RNA binding domain protein 3 [Diplonema papillatum]|nr:Triple RNA binding domain protein 3 [Diplonema papillatum]
MDAQEVDARGHTLASTPFGLTKVYVDYLPRSNDGLQDKLEAFFNCGKIIKMLKKSGKTSGYVVFKKPNSVRLALRKNNENFGGKRLRVEVPKGLFDSEDGAKADVVVRKKKKYVQNTDRETQANTQVYISHLAAPVNRDILMSVVEGERPKLALSVTSVKMIAGKNCCFITLSGEKDVTAFCEAFDGYPLLGQQLQVRPAQAPGVIRKDGTWKPWEVADKVENNAQQYANEVEKDENEAEEREDEEENEDEEDEKPTPSASESEHARPLTQQQCSRILIGKFADAAKTEDVKRLLSKCGRIRKIYKVHAKLTGTFTGIFSVQFSAPKEANKAITTFHDRPSALADGSSLTAELDASAAEPLPKPSPVPRTPTRRHTVLCQPPPAKASGSSSSPTNSQRSPNAPTTPEAKRLAMREKNKKMREEAQQRKHASESATPAKRKTYASDSDLSIDSDDARTKTPPSTQRKKKLKKVSKKTVDTLDDDFFEEADARKPVL